MVQSLIQSKKPKQMAKTDVVFCIDISESMTPCIDGVRNNIKSFIGSIEKDPDIAIDWRLGILAHHWVEEPTFRFYRLSFCSELDQFRSALDSLKTDGDEGNLPALDWALDFPWRADAHKFVMLFTNEGVNGGWEPDTCRSKLDDLMKKIAALGASVCVVSPDGSDYDDYKRLCTANKCRFIPIPAGSNFKTVGFFDDLMTKLGKSVSQGSRGMAGAQQSVQKDIFGVSARVQMTDI